MQQLDTSVRLLDASAQVVRNSFQQSIFSKFQAVKQKRGSGSCDSGSSLISLFPKHIHPYQYQIDANYILSQYSVLFKHMETLWGSMDPSFSLCLCIPCKAFGRNPTVIPRLLSTMVVRQNAGILLDVEDHKISQPSDFDIQRHNLQMHSIYSKFSQKITNLRNAKRIKKLVDEQNAMKKRKLLETQECASAVTLKAAAVQSRTSSITSNISEIKKKKVNVVVRNA